MHFLAEMLPIMLESTYKRMYINVSMYLFISVYMYIALFSFFFPQKIQKRSLANIKC